jgi:hypothetical protein
MTIPINHNGMWEAGEVDEASILKTGQPISVRGQDASSAARRGFEGGHGVPSWQRRSYSNSHASDRGHDGGFWPESEATAARRGGRFLGNTRRRGGRRPNRRSPPRLARVSYRSKSRRGGCKSWWLFMTVQRS